MPRIRVLLTRTTTITETAIWEGDIAERNIAAFRSNEPRALEWAEHNVPFILRRDAWQPKGLPQIAHQVERIDFPHEGPAILPAKKPPPPIAQEPAKPPAERARSPAELARKTGTRYAPTALRRQEMAAARAAGFDVYQHDESAYWHIRTPEAADNPASATYRTEARAWTRVLTLHKLAMKAKQTP